MIDSYGQSALQSVEDLTFGRRPVIPQAGTPNAIRKAAVDFEAVFASEMLKPMFEELETDGMFGGGQSESVFRSLMIQEFGNEIAKRGELGIADAMERELLRLQEQMSVSGPATQAQPSAQEIPS